MTITQSLRDETATSRSITQAIDNLADAVRSGTFTSRSTRNTDKRGQVVEISKTVAETGEVVGVKKAERFIADDNIKDGDGIERIVWNGTFLTINGGEGTVAKQYDFVVSDGERVTISYGRSSVESTSSYVVVYFYGERTTVQTGALSATDFEIVGQPGVSAMIQIVSSDDEGYGVNGSFEVVFSPVIDVSDPFDPAYPEGVPEWVSSYIPKLLPSVAPNTTGGGLYRTTSFQFEFPDGLRPWYGLGSDYVNAAFLIVKYSGVNMPFGMVLEPEQQMWRVAGGMIEGVSDELWEGGVMMKGSVLMGGYIAAWFTMNEGEYLSTQDPFIWRIQVHHGLDLVFPSLVKTLGYFIVEGR